MLVGELDGERKIEEGKMRKEDGVGKLDGRNENKRRRKYREFGRTRFERNKGAEGEILKTKRQ